MFRVRNIFRRTVARSPQTRAPQATSSAILQSALQLHRSGRLHEARSLYEQATELDPTSDVAHNLLGALICSQDDLGAGEACFRRALDANPTNIEALNNLANVCNDRHDVAEAERLYRRALELRPTFAAAANNLGLLYVGADRLDDAAESFRQAVASDPTNADAHNNLGAVLRKQGAYSEAEIAFRNAIAANSAHPEAYCGLGDVLAMRGALDEAEACCMKAVELRPNYADALNNLATIAKLREDLHVAQSYCEDALRIDGAHIGVLNNLASIATRRADHHKARTIYRTALGIDPTHAVTRFNLGMTLLMLGEYAEGLELYESRFEATGRRFTQVAALDRALGSRQTWRGEPLPSGRLLVWGEQGLGDALMMLRYLPQLRSHGVSSVTVLCDPSLERIVRSVAGIDQVVTSHEEAARLDFDAHCPMMSLLRAFDTTPATIPAAVPYIHVPEAVTDVWRARLAGEPRRKIGVAWAGSRTLRDDARRSISLHALTPLLSSDRFVFVSLQKGEAAKEWSQAGYPGGEYIEECADFLDTAALVTALDLVISVDTALAHLAGALGKPVWLLNRFGSEWRWGMDSETAPWYPTMKVFRQAEPGTWAAAVNRIIGELLLVGDRDSRQGSRPLN